ncbi:hypothetical protein C8Q75DRAFT_731381 [Abortiporus biennis]|nr:hypothetical protein C8Q75DRAFT_731381 [Abortiporus biennis]
MLVTFHSFAIFTDLLLLISLLLMIPPTMPTSSLHIKKFAFLAGGILWRLAIDALSPDIVLNGPSILATEQSHSWIIDSMIVTDDVLYIDEEKYVCGVHKKPNFDALKFNTQSPRANAYSIKVTKEMIATV